VVSAGHRTVGVSLAERWNLDPEVVASIRDLDEYDAADRTCVANVIRFANALVKLHGLPGGHVEQEETEALVLIGRSMLDLDEDAVARLIEGLNARVDGSLALAS
jgi:HD-like signal output (HDOD) protein